MARRGSVARLRCPQAKLRGSGEGNGRARDSGAIPGVAHTAADVRLKGGSFCPDTPLYGDKPMYSESSDDRW